MPFVTLENLVDHLKGFRAELWEDYHAVLTRGTGPEAERQAADLTTLMDRLYESEKYLATYLARWYPHGVLSRGQGSVP